MKHLLLMRHAKSSWGDESLNDFDRPLNDRGNGDASRMGHVLKAKKLIPDLILCSTALRARQTAAHLIEHEGGLEGVEIRYLPNLYGASARTLLSAAQSVKDSCRMVMLIAHNPGIGELAESLSGKWLPQGMKTGAVVHIGLDVKEWVLAEEGELLDVLYPRDFGGVAD